MEKNQVKIAIVEDDSNLRFLVSQRVAAEGYQVFEAADGNEGEELIMREKPHIVLLDWMLPGKTGSEVCSSIREKDYTGIVIMITAKAQDVDKINAYNFGVTDYITKPFNMDVLIALIYNKVKYIVNSEKTDVVKFAD